MLGAILSQTPTYLTGAPSASSSLLKTTGAVLKAPKLPRRSHHTRARIDPMIGPHPVDIEQAQPHAGEIPRRNRSSSTLPTPARMAYTVASPGYSSHSPFFMIERLWRHALIASQTSSRCKRSISDLHDRAGSISPLLARMVEGLRSAFAQAHATIEVSPAGRRILRDTNAAAHESALGQ